VDVVDCLLATNIEGSDVQMKLPNFDKSGLNSKAYYTRLDYAGKAIAPLIAAEFPRNLRLSIL
jgi:hypothetical protein